MASRPGFAFTNMISRTLNRDILNFGFSGNGIMEISVAEFLTQIPEPAAFIIDCNWNMDGPTIASHAVPLVQVSGKIQ